jgi:hypothetical protein
LGSEGRKEGVGRKEGKEGRLNPPPVAIKQVTEGMKVKEGRKVKERRKEGR